MTTDIHTTLTKQLRIVKLEQKRSVARQLAALVQLRPFFVRHLRYAEAEGDTLFIRAFVKELKRVNASFQSLMGIINAAGDFSHGDFFEFAQRCALLAGIDMATDNSQKFFEAYLATQKCPDCNAAYKAHGLSGALLAEPFPMELCHEICHMGEVAKSHFIEPLWKTLDELIPQPDN